jgi:hypothetical protein
MISRKRGFRAMLLGVVAAAGVALAPAAFAGGHVGIGINAPGVSVGYWGGHHGRGFVDVGVGGYGGYYGGYYAPGYYYDPYYAPVVYSSYYYPGRGYYNHYYPSHRYYNNHHYNNHYNNNNHYNHH